MKALKIGCLSCLLIIAFFIILIIGYAMWSASLMGSESELTEGLSPCEFET